MAMLNNQRVVQIANLLAHHVFQSWTNIGSARYTYHTVPHMIRSGPKSFRSDLAHRLYGSTWNNHSKFGDLRLVELLENANHDPMTPHDYVVQPLNYQAISGPWAPNLGYQYLVSNHFRYLPRIYPIFPITIWVGYISPIKSRETPLNPMKS